MSPRGAPTLHKSVSVDAVAARPSPPPSSSGALTKSLDFEMTQPMPSVPVAVQGAGLVGGWRYEDGVLKTYEVRTEGEWPFEDEQRDLLINVKYRFDGKRVVAVEGSASKGELTGSMFKWSCKTGSQEHLLYEYVWDEESMEFNPTSAYAKDLPVWEVGPHIIKNAQGMDGKTFPNCFVEGSLPPVICLVVAMHRCFFLFLVLFLET